MPFSDALDREAAWLNTTGDTLPPLPLSGGGVWELLQPRWPRVPSTRKRALYVMRAPSGSYKITRYAAIRSTVTTDILLRLLWPLSNRTGSAETEQLLLDQAIDQVLTRVMGFQGDKTHGGRFKAVGEEHTGIVVHYDDPEKAMTGDGVFRCEITYTAEDPEIIN